MKKSLFLHEAIAVVLKDRPDRTATFKEISSEIAKRGLYFRKKDNLPPPDYQIKMRTTLAGGRYHHMFEFIPPDKIRLKSY